MFDRENVYSYNSEEANHQQKPCRASFHVNEISNWWDTDYHLLQLQLPFQLPVKRTYLSTNTY